MEDFTKSNAKDELKSLLTINDFHIIELINNGAHGSVFCALNIKDNKKYAIKKIILKNQSKEIFDRAIKECFILKNLSHPNIVKYYGDFLNDGSLYIIMEYAQKGDLEKR